MYELNDRQLEIAARRYCVLTNSDPDCLVQMPSPTDSNGRVLEVFVQCPQWKIIAEQIKTHWLMTDAIHYALNK